MLIRAAVCYAFFAFFVSLYSVNESRHIVLPVPPRQPGQRSVVELATAPLETVRIGIVGLGIRGLQALRRLERIPGAQVTALCDVNDTQLAQAQQEMPGASAFTDWRQLCASERVNLVYICTDWQHHVEVALEAMDHGKHVAVEVPAAGTLEQIWALVDKAEQTRLHCMMLENSVYDFFERVVLEMARAGVFGEIVHAEGAYLHKLDFNKEVWRREYNRGHRGDVYPTHGIGPVCQALGIHRTDKLQTLVSLDTASFTGKALTGDAAFANADQTTTLLRTQNGKTILIEHNVMTPRPYSRMYQLVGTLGYAAKYPVPQICLLEDGKERIYEGAQLDALMAPYVSAGLPEPLKAVAREVDAKHEGMDLLMDYRLIQALRGGRPLDMDVYDLAEWCALAPLSALSLEAGGAPVHFPDFTRASARSGK